MMKIETKYTGSFTGMARVIEDSVSNALYGCAEDILRDAKDNCPQKGGELKSSLKVKNRDTKMEIYSDLPYASIIETGDSKHISNPFLSRALYENEYNLTQSLTRALSEEK